MHVADPGGANPVDLEATHNYKVRVPQEWESSHQKRSNLAFIPGRGDHVDMGGHPNYAPRTLEVMGFVEGSDLSDCLSKIAGLKADLKLDEDEPDDEIEFWFTETGSDIIATGRVLRATVLLGADHGARDIPVRIVNLTIEMKDPRRYDISGGRPGTVAP